MNFPTTKLTHLFMSNNNDKPTGVLDFEQTTNEAQIRLSIGLIYIRKSEYSFSVQFKSKTTIIFEQTLQTQFNTENLPSGNLLSEDVFGSMLDFKSENIKFIDNGPVTISVTLYDQYGFELDSLKTNIWVKNVPQ